MKTAMIFKAAEIRLAEIWDYTCDTWGEEQADRYLRELAACMNGLDSQRTLWRRIGDKRIPGVFYVRCAHHFIFFRELPDAFAVISILHENMDLVRRLREDAGDA